MASVGLVGGEGLIRVPEDTVLEHERRSPAVRARCGHVGRRPVQAIPAAGPAAVEEARDDAEDLVGLVAVP
jgi:hypothetical protein